ncbi:WhiB family transcriptional regulator [Mycobacterium sp. HNNTM2301]|uniref:WhiB family transcriptional regulator n=1 Tax=Mycobacterium hainanense TaxID=3289775 RepID=UPI0035A6741B
MTTASELIADVRAQPDLSAGLCVGEPELWGDPEDPVLVDRAIALCTECPVLQVCAEWAGGLAEGSVHGVVGGQVRQWLSPNQRWRRGRRAA